MYPPCKLYSSSSSSSSSLSLQPLMNTYSICTCWCSWTLFSIPHIKPFLPTFYTYLVLHSFPHFIPFIWDHFLSVYIFKSSHSEDLLVEDFLGSISLQLTVFIPIAKRYFHWVWNWPMFSSTFTRSFHYARTPTVSVEKSPVCLSLFYVKSLHSPAYKIFSLF